MDFLEKDLEDILFDAPPDEISQKGLHCFKYDSIFRQVNLNVYGIVDLLTIKKAVKYLHITIYELKNKELNASAFWQAVRYVKGINHWLSAYDLSNHHVEISVVFIGRTIDEKSDFCFLPSLNTNCSFYTYSYGYSGISFKRLHDTYCKSGFKIPNTEQFGSYSIIDFAKEFLITSRISEEING